MFLGHVAVGLASKRAAPGTSLGWLIAAPILADLLWPIFLLAGWERVRIDPGNTAVTPLAFDSYPWSHSLVMLVAWGAALAALYLTVAREPRAVAARGAWVIALAVVSHWILDAVSHRPDMPISPWGGPLVGLGLWNSLPATVLVEASLFAWGIALYATRTRAADRIGLYAMEAFFVFLAVLYAGVVFAPPPPSVSAVVWSALAAWLLPLWAWWFDAHRRKTP